MSGDETELTVSFIRSNAESVRSSPDKRWLLWIYEDILLWKMVGVWPTPVARAHFTEVWQHFLSQREKHNPVFFLIDTDDFAPQSYEFRDLLVKEWSHILDRGDLVICLVASDPMRRAVRNTMAMLAGRLDQFRFYRSFEAALRFITRKRRESAGSQGSVQRTIGDVVDQLTRAHERLAQEHDQDMLESEIVSDLEHRFQQMFEEFPAAVFYLDLWGRFAWGNRKAAEAFGCSMQDLVGLSYYESWLATFEDLVRASRLMSELPSKPPVWPLEFSVVRKDGTRVRLEVTEHLTSFGSKEVILCIGTDVTARKARRPAQGQRSGKSGVLCARCHRIRDRSGRWLSPEQFHRLHLGVKFEHGVCPDCAGETRVSGTGQDAAEAPQRTPPDAPLGAPPDTPPEAAPDLPPSGQTPDPEGLR